MKFKDLLKLAAWELLNPLLLKMKKNKIYRFKESYSGINLGCGLDNPSKWIGVDGGISVVISRLPSPLIKFFYGFQNTSKNIDVDVFIKKIKSADIIHHDFRYGIPFQDESVPNIYSSHFFEHLTKEHCREILKDCFRVMKKNGIIRICVPSLEEEVKKIRIALEAYDRGNVIPIEKYVTQSASGYLSEYSNHRWMYNFEELKTVLSEAGFVNIVQKSFGVGQLPDVEILETRSGLHVEASKSIT